MAKPIRHSPSVVEKDQPRALEYFLNEIERQLSLVGTVTVNVGSIAGGAKASFTIPVQGCRADQQQTVQVGLPAAFNASLVPWGYVSADDVVTVVLYNPTGAPIDPPNAVYGCRVML